MDIGISIIAFVLLVGLGLVVRDVRRRGALNRLSKREAFDDNQIYEHFYAQSDFGQPEVMELWHEVADVLRVPAEKMRPEDKLGKDVGVYWLTSEELDELGEIAQRRAKQKGLSFEPESIQTVDDYVRLLLTHT